MLVPKKMEVYPRSALVREAAMEGSYEAPIAGLSTDMRTFVEKVGYKLMPGDARMRRKYRMGLEETLLGRGAFNDWFNNTGVDLGISSYNLLKILYDSLEGLSSSEARQLKQEYQAAMHKMASFV